MSLDHPSDFVSTPSEDKFLPDRPILASDYKPIIRNNQRLWLRPWFRAPGLKGSFSTSNTSYTQVNAISDEPDLSEWRPNIVPTREVVTSGDETTKQFFFRFHAYLRNIEVRIQVETLQVDPVNNQITRNALGTIDLNEISGTLSNLSQDGTVNRSHFEDPNGHLLTAEFQIEMRDNETGNPLLEHWFVDAGIADNTGLTAAKLPEWHKF